MKLYQLWEIADGGMALITETYDRAYFYDRVMPLRQELRLRDDSKLEIAVVFEPESFSSAACSAAQADAEAAEIVVHRAMDLKGFPKMKHRLNAGIGLDPFEYRATFGYNRSLRDGG